MKKSTFLTMTASAALLVAATACGSTKAAEKPADDAAKTAEGHCGADKPAHEGSCAPAATPPADAPPADGAAPAPTTP